MAEGNAEISNKGLFNGIFACCFPISREWPVDSAPAAPQLEPNEIQRDPDIADGTGSQSPSKSSSAVIDGMHALLPTAQPLALNYTSSPPSSDPPRVQPSQPQQAH